MKMSRWREFSSVKRASIMIQDTAALLKTSGHEGTVAELQKALDAIERGTPFSRKEAFASVASMCHPRWLGDMFVQDLDWAEWNAQLERLRGACIKAFNKLESEFCNLSEEERKQEG
jgi:hypothetical protein